MFKSNGIPFDSHNIVETSFLNFVTTNDGKFLSQTEHVTNNCVISNHTPIGTDRKLTTVRVQACKVFDNVRHDYKPSGKLYISEEHFKIVKHLPKRGVFTKCGIGNTEQIITSAVITVHQRNLSNPFAGNTYYTYNNFSMYFTGSTFIPFKILNRNRSFVSGGYLTPDFTTNNIFQSINEDFEHMHTTYVRPIILLYFRILNNGAKYVILCTTLISTSNFSHIMEYKEIYNNDKTVVVQQENRFTIFSSYSFKTINTVRLQERLSEKKRHTEHLVSIIEHDGIFDGFIIEGEKCGISYTHESKRKLIYFN